MQDQRSKELKAIAWLVDGLYLLDQSSFNGKLIDSIHKCNSVTNIIACNKKTIDSWHMKLGYASFNSLSHITGINVNPNALYCETCPQAKQADYLLI